MKVGDVGRNCGAGLERILCKLPKRLDLISN